MKLHEDTDAFLAILQRVNESSGVRVDILEKDYYVTLLLKELAEKQNSLPAYFKGGTALYKALGTIQRFSEDIDLTVCVDDCTTAQARFRLEEAAQGYGSLRRTENKDMEDCHESSISCVYDYSPISSFPANDPLQRFGHVRIEATSYTVSEPTTLVNIAPALFEKASADQRSILENNYHVKPFSIKTVKIERIFIDKVFAAEFYYGKKRYSDAAKHLYDIAVMYQLDQIKDLLANEVQLQEMVAYKRKEESTWSESDLDRKAFADYVLASDASKNEDFEKAYNRMQEVYVFDDIYLVDFALACTTITKVLSAIA